ncbi:hypothetical protein [Mucilaginibacter sp. UR6-11]|uniref:hypothetical protein n=1 Tax=Mucilaginibacter sp. UR6-11 TaxID=1435644 RepID=UPI001E4AB937|nr:hypothetical protein [Mucilaginibacter sp. UR6-11]MCC8423560.1 hypothetical protein [Mucilaginibacter sp. UR6-11]
MERARDIATVAHHWANGIGEQARASNLFFEQENIYSYGYHFLIAKHVYNDSGGHAILITQKKYSKSTSAHVTLVRQASRHIQQISVPNPEWPAAELFEKWYSIIKGIAGGLNNSRKPEKDILEIQAIFSEAKNYADFFGYEIPEILQQAGKIKNLGQYQEVIQKETQLRKAQAKREKAEALRIQNVNLKRWRRFQTNYITTADGYDYLRYDKATERIETTQRVEIPLVVGKQFYSVVLATIANGGCKNCPDKLMNLYDVLEINARFIRVGCHKINLKEIKSFAKQQGWV